MIIWKSNSFDVSMPMDVVAQLAAKLGYERNTLSGTFKLPEQGSAVRMNEWYSEFDDEDKEKVAEVIRLICQPELVADVMQVEDDVISIYRVLIGSQNPDSPVLVVSESGEELYSCSLKKDKYVLYEELFPAIGTGNPYWETPFAFQLDRKEFYALHAIIDLNTRGRYSALLDQKPYDSSLRISDLERVVGISQEQPDWRWSASFMNAAMPGLDRLPKGKELMDSLMTLAKEGFIIMDDDHVQIELSESGRFYADSISRKYSCMNINRISCDSDGSHVGQGLVLITSDKFLWTMDIGWLSDDKVVVSSIDGSLVEQIIDDLLTPTGKPKIMDKAEMEGDSSQEGPEQYDMADTRRIPEVDSETIYCHKCGSSIPAGSKFCSECGAKQ